VLADAVPDALAAVRHDDTNAASTEASRLRHVVPSRADWERAFKCDPNVAQIKHHAATLCLKPRPRANTRYPTSC
jgi:hypothetical protein